MKKSLLFLGMMFLMAPAANADITSKLSSSVQLTVDAAASQATRIGSTYSVSGNNIKPMMVQQSPSQNHLHKVMLLM